MYDADLYPDASKIVFAEKFTRPGTVARNLGIISGNPTIQNGVYEGDGAGDFYHVQTSLQPWNHPYFLCEIAGEVSCCYDSADRSIRAIRVREIR